MAGFRSKAITLVLIAVGAGVTVASLVYDGKLRPDAVPTGAMPQTGATAFGPGRSTTCTWTASGWTRRKSPTASSQSS